MKRGYRGMEVLITSMSLFIFEQSLQITERHGD